MTLIAMNNDQTLLSGKNHCRASQAVTFPTFPLKPHTGCRIPRCQRLRSPDNHAYWRFLPLLMNALSSRLLAPALLIPLQAAGECHRPPLQLFDQIRGISMAIRFEIKSNEQQEFSFHLLNDANEVLLMSALYPDQSSLEDCIKQVRVGTLMGHLIAAGKTPGGETFFVIKNDKGQVIAKSGLYANQMEFDNALHSVKDNACIAAITQAA